VLTDGTGIIFQTAGMDFAATISQYFMGIVSVKEQLMARITCFFPQLDHKRVTITIGNLE
jgi:hypothetical protein